MKNVDTLETERLVGRRVRPDDFDLMRRILQDPLVAATLGGVRSDEEVRDFLARNLKQWDQHGYGRWMWHSKKDGGFVGRGGLLNIELEGREQIEVGYAIVPEFWNQGLATEIARESIRIALEELDMPILVCFTMPTNLASRRVMEKAGFIYERDFVWQNVPHVLYWLKR
jgi:ribosomal-protein-alanine N-acetyltransferase